MIGLVSVARVLLAMEDGMLSPSRHFDTKVVPLPNNMEVVKENMRTLDTYMGVNSLGQGGYHVHTILKPHDKKRLLLYCLCDKMRLCVYSGATERGLQKVFKVSITMFVSCQLLLFRHYDQHLLFTFDVPLFAFFVQASHISHWL